MPVGGMPACPVAISGSARQIFGGRRNPIHLPASECVPHALHEPTAQVSEVIASEKNLDRVSDRLAPSNIFSMRYQISSVWMPLKSPERGNA